MHKVTLISGDGIGPEVSKVCVDIVNALGVDVKWDYQEAGVSALEKVGSLVPDSLIESIRKNKVVLKGPLMTPIGSGFRSVNVTLRKTFDLYANIRPVHNIGTVPSVFRNVDLIIFRENTEDLYAGIEHQINEDEAHSLKVITREKSLRIVMKAFEYASSHRCAKVTVVTKANIMKLTDGLFLQVARDVAQIFSEIELEEVLVDNMCMQLVLNPSQYHVIVTENLYGDILSDLCAGLVGGLGLVPSANVGKDMALFEAVHGTAPNIAGKNRANPSAMLLSTAMMLEYLGEQQAANSLRTALTNLLSDKKNYTEDLGGTCSTSDFSKELCERIRYGI